MLGFFCLNENLVQARRHYWEKFRFFSFDFCQYFRLLNISALTEQTQNQFFLCKFSYQKFLLNVHFCILFSRKSRFVRLLLVLNKQILQTLAESAQKRFIAQWANAVTNSSLAESMQKEFSHMLRKNVVDIRPNGQPARNEFHRCPSQCGNDLIADWVNVETVLPLTESTRKWFFRWVNGEIFRKITLQDRFRALTANCQPNLSSA